MLYFCEVSVRYMYVLCVWCLWSLCGVCGSVGSMCVVYGVCLWGLYGVSVLSLCVCSV